jgi:putative transposase
MEDFLKRKLLPHDVPYWVHGNPIYFITINTETKGTNTLAVDKSAEIIKKTFLFEQKRNKIWVEYLLLMPDHLHMLIVFNDSPIQKTISLLKRYITNNSEIKWQRDFFEHRIRNNESLSDKIRYIENNPVRKGFVSKPNDWKYQWIDGMQELKRTDAPEARPYQ